MRVSVFVGVSIDGFLAQPDRSLDFLKPFERHDLGFQFFLASADTLVVGRATYDAVCGLPIWPWQNKRVIVLTHRPLDAKHGETTYAGALAPLLQRLEHEGARQVYLDGGVAIRQGLDQDLVDDLTLSTVPVTIGAGIPLFGSAPRRLAWNLTSSRAFPSGVVQARYERARS
jgi:dihydrofolate reductase